MIRRRPSNVDDALCNLRAFSAEGYSSGKQLKGYIPILSLPDITRCYGWIKLKVNELPSQYETYQQHYPSDTGLDRYALVYDYIPDGVVNLEVGQAQLDFFYQLGFGITHYREPNWRQGRLVDFGDLLTVLDMATFSLRCWHEVNSAAWFGISKTRAPTTVTTASRCKCGCRNGSCGRASRTLARTIAAGTPADKAA